MKKYISAVLVLMILILCIQVLPVSASSAIVMSMDTESDVTKWKVGSYAASAASQANISQEYVKIGNYSLKVTNLSSNNKVALEGLSIPINGMSQAHLWVYGDVGTSTSVKLNMYIIISGSTIRITHQLVNGWQLVSWSIPNTSQNGNITQVQYTSYGYGNDASNAPADYSAATIYMNGMFLTDGAPVNPEITASSIAEGTQLVKHDVGKVVFTAPGIKSAAAGGITISPAVTLDTPSVSNNTLTLNFLENLAYGETYTISLNSGLYDNLGMEFKPYTLSFRVRGENENIPPSVAMVSPSNGTRFVPGEEIILTATATDDSATAQYGISYVEFYCDSVLIEGSRVTTGVDDEFTYVWTDAEESFEPYNITAKAVDVEGAEVLTDPVSILVLGYRNPTVDITSPEDRVEIYNSVGGVVSDSGVTVTADISDLDGEVSAVEVFLDDESVHTATEGLEEFSYTFDSALSVGEHTIKIVAADDTGMTGEASIDINVIDLGPSYPAVLQNDLTLAKWNISQSTAKIEKTETGIVITTDADATAQISRPITRNMSISPWQADVKIIPGDTNHKIEVGITNAAGTAISLLTFEADGTLNDTANTAYEANKEYKKSAVADTVSGKISCLVDGRVVSTTSYTKTNYSSNAAAYVTHSGASAKTTVTSVEFFMLKEASQLSGINIQSGAGTASNSAVPLLPDYITVDLEGGTDTDTVADNVKVYEKVSGKEIAVSYSGDKIYFEEFLKSGKEYTVAVGSAVANTSGRGLAGIQTMDFTTAKSPVHIEMVEEGSSLKVSAENTGSAFTAKIIMVVMNGNKAVLPVSVTDFTIGAGNSNTTVAFPAISEGYVIEAFVVDNLTDLKPISDSIYIKK